MRWRGWSRNAACARVTSDDPRPLAPVAGEGWGVITRLFLALNSELPFALAWKRAGHLADGHPFALSTKVESHRYEKHPKNSKDFVYVVNLMRCDDCGLHWQDAGMECRYGVKAFLHRGMY